MSVQLEYTLHCDVCVDRLEGPHFSRDDVVAVALREGWKAAAHSKASVRLLARSAWICAQCKDDGHVWDSGSEKWVKP